SRDRQPARYRPGAAGGLQLLALEDEPPPHLRRRAHLLRVGDDRASDDDVPAAPPGNVSGSRGGGNTGCPAGEGRSDEEERHRDRYSASPIRAAERQAGEKGGDGKRQPDDGAEFERLAERRARGGAEEGPEQRA